MRSRVNKARYVSLHKASTKATKHLHQAAACLHVASRLQTSNTPFPIFTSTRGYPTVTSESLHYPFPFGSLTTEFPQKTSTPALNTPPLSTCFVTPTATASLLASKQLFHSGAAALLLVPDIRLFPVPVPVLVPRRRPHRPPRTHPAKPQSRPPRIHLTKPQSPTRTRSLKPQKVITRVTRMVAAGVTARVEQSGVEMPTVLERGIGGRIQRGIGGIRQGEI